MRCADGRVLLGVDLVTGEERYISMSDTCTIAPVTDDMAMCPPSIQKSGGKLSLVDGEDGWFVRVDGITSYGCDPMYERIAIHSKEPLMFLNLEPCRARPACLGACAGLRRQALPEPAHNRAAAMIENIVTQPVDVDVRSFGVRMPPATAKKRPTASWASCTSSRLRWPGCGGWWPRAASRTPA